MKLLIVEDDLGLHSQYKWELEEFDTTFATDRDSAIEAIQKTQPDVVLLDLGLPPDEDNAEEGLRVLSAIMSQVPEAKVIVLTGSENHEHALRAQQLGACNYIQKGTDMAMVKYAIDSAYKMQSLERENKSLSERTISQTAIIGSSAAMQNAMKKTVRISKTPVSVMLSGESGTGKEMFANNIHSLSGRTGKFVAINCASIPGELLESVLFGHEKGAFTGANKRTIGKVELAQGGTLFLDEIGDMPHDLQAKMLRFLQERVVERVGVDRLDDRDLIGDRAEMGEHLRDFRAALAVPGEVDRRREERGGGKQRGGEALDLGPRGGQAPSGHPDCL